MWTGGGCSAVCLDAIVSPTWLQQSLDVAFALSLVVGRVGHAHSAARLNRINGCQQTTAGRRVATYNLNTPCQCKGGIAQD